MESVGINHHITKTKAIARRNPVVAQAPSRQTHTKRPVTEVLFIDFGLVRRNRYCYELPPGLVRNGVTAISEIGVLLFNEFKRTDQLTDGAD